MLIDIDPQGNATMGSGVDKNQLNNNLTELLLGEKEFNDVCITSPSGYDLLPSNSDLTAAEVELLSSSQHEKRLYELLKPVVDSYDFILIDCPPSLNVLTLNALVAADSILIPMQCEYYALEGLSGLLNTIKHLSSTVNPRLEVEGICGRCMMGVIVYQFEVSEQLLQHFGEKVYRAVIPRNVRLAEAPSHGMSALHYDKRSHGSNCIFSACWRNITSPSTNA